MSQENVEKLRAFLETWDPKSTLDAWKRDEVDVSLFDPEIAYEDTILPDHATETYHGYEGLVRATERWLGSFESLTIKLNRLVGTGERVVSIQEVWMKALHSGIEFEATFAYVWTFRDGRVVHIKSYSNPAAALEAAGLQE